MISTIYLAAATLSASLLAALYLIYTGLLDRNKSEIIVGMMIIFMVAVNVMILEALIAQ